MNSLLIRQRRKLAGMLLALTVIAAAGCSAEAPAKTEDGFVSRIASKYPELKKKPHSTERVKRVVDGDTFETEDGAKVRLIGVDTPESIGQVEPYGKEASEYSKARLTGQSVVLFSDTGDTDKYGRLLRYVFIEGDALMYNERLVREGFANPMTVPPNVMYAELFVSAEREARSAGLGLWKTAKNESASASSGGSGIAPAKSRAASDVGGSASGSCAEPKVKGNINAKNEKIYHVPGSRYYEQTKAEELFCTAGDAESAGFRAPK